MIERKNITGIILAGGKSSRMGSDKGFLDLSGQCFIEHIIRTIEPLVHQIIIVSNNSDYDIFNQKRVDDMIKDAGPLAGLYSGLFHSETEINLVLSCDVPFINNIVLNKLIQAFDGETEVIQIQSQGKTMPLIAIYKRECFHLFLSLLQSGERRLRFAVSQLNSKIILIDDAQNQYVRNVNTESQYKTLIDGVKN